MNSNSQFPSYPQEQRAHITHTQTFNFQLLPKVETFKASLRNLEKTFESDRERKEVRGGEGRVKGRERENIRGGSEKAGDENIKILNTIKRTLILFEKQTDYYFKLYNSQYYHFKQ